MQIALNCAPGDLINNKPAQFQAKDWWQTGQKPISEEMMADFTYAYTLYAQLAPRTYNSKTILLNDNKSAISCS